MEVGFFGGRTEFYSDAHVVVENMNVQGTGVVGVIGDRGVARCDVMPPHSRRIRWKVASLCEHRNGVPTIPIYVDIVDCLRKSVNDSAFESY
jgi:hypothetical protein